MLLARVRPAVLHTVRQITELDGCSRELLARAVKFMRLISLSLIVFPSL